MKLSDDWIAFFQSGSVADYLRVKNTVNKQECMDVDDKSDSLDSPVGKSLSYMQDVRIDMGVNKDAGFYHGDRNGYKDITCG